MHKLHTSINDLWHLITLSQNVCTFVYILVELHCVWLVSQCRRDYQRYFVCFGQVLFS